ncbi:MAG: sensor histidine kinase, partial [Pseudomonadota bacterium]
MTSRPDEHAFSLRIARRDRWLVRIVVIAFVAVAVAAVSVSNLFLTERFTESTRNRTEVRLALYVG